MGKLISLEKVKEARDNGQIAHSLKVEIAVEGLISRLNKDILYHSHRKSWQLSVSSLDEVSCAAIKTIAASDLFGSEYTTQVIFEGRETSLVVLAKKFKLAS